MSTDMQKTIDETFQHLMKTYAPQPIVLERGEGIYAYDTDGKRYIDCAIGYAVASLGHAPKGLVDVITKQAGTLMACQASYTTEVKLKAARILTDNSVFDEVFFANSGTESIEAALKIARKWAYDNKSEDAHEFIAFHGSFHGRSYGSSSVTSKALTQPFFAPYVPGVHFADFNDLESVKALISDKTAAIILEPVQGEGGLVAATPEFLKGVRALCDEHKIALIFDEVQAGMGRMGTLFAYESYGVEPDIIGLAKGIGSGFPVGATLAKKEFAAAFVPGTHGTTYGGNPLACAVVAYVVGEIVKPEFLAHVRKIDTLLREGVQAIQERSNKITGTRGKGLMLGLETNVDIKELVAALQKNGLMTTIAGGTILRITPPLIISEQEAQDVLTILEDTLKEL